MKNLKRLLGLMAISGFAFGFAGNVKAQNYTGALKTKFIECITENVDTNICTLNGDLTLTSTDMSGRTLNPTRLTITVESGSTLTLNGTTLDVQNGKELILNGSGSIVRSDSASANVIKVNTGATLTTSNIKLSSQKNITVSGGNKPVIYVAGGASSTQVTKVNINAGTTIDGYAGVIVYPNAYTSSGASYATINLNAGTFTTEHYAVQVNGTVNAGTTEVNIAGGNYTSTKNVALYAAGVSKWNIKGGVVTGTSAIMAKGGEVTVTGGTFTGNGKDCYSLKTNKVAGSNAQVTGSAVTAIDQSADGYTNAAKVHINGGTFKSNSCSALHNQSMNNNIEITKGTFTAPEGKDAITGSENGVKITGGEYSKIDNKYLGSLASAKVGNNYVVGNGIPVTIKVIEENGVKKYLASNPITIIKGYEFALADYVTVQANKGYHAVYTAVDDNNAEVKITNGKISVANDSKINSITVTIKFAEGEEPTPVDPNKPGTTTGDNKPSKNPQTYDGILSYVTLAISSLGALGFATKKVLF